MQLPDEIRQLVDVQLGLVTRRQLNTAGVPAGLTRWHSADRWRSLLPGVLMLNAGLPTLDQQLLAALLHAGPQSWRAGMSALTRHTPGRSARALPVQVYVPHPHRSRRVAWVTIRATRLTNERIVERGPIEEHLGRRLTTPDLWLDDVALAVMVHSRQFHSGVLEWDATVDADSDLRDEGVEVVPVTPFAIEHHSDAVLARAEAGYLRAKARPRPAVVAHPTAGLHRTG